MESGICFIIPFTNIYDYEEIGCAQPVNEVGKNVNWKKKPFPYYADVGAYL